MKIVWNKGLLCGLILLLPGGSGAAAAADEFVIVKSSDNAYFNQTIETLVNHVDRGLRFRTLMAQELPAALEGGEHRYFITLGQAAAEAVARLGTVPVTFAAYLTHEQFEDLGRGNQSVVLLDQPLYRYLAFSHLLLRADAIGLLDEEEISLDETEAEVMQKLGVELRQYRVDAQNKLLPVLRRLLRQNDVLLMLPRRAIYNRDSLKGVLLTSYRNRKPAISYSPAHVKSGALASIYSSPVDIGRHLAQLINRKLENPARALPDFQYARFYSIATNRQIARALGIDLPAERDLRSALDGLEP